MPNADGVRTAYQARGRMIHAGPGPASTWNVANLITIGRILLVPVFLWLLFAAPPSPDPAFVIHVHQNGGLGSATGADDGTLRWLAAALFIVAIATDSVDGHLARGRDLVTTLGILLDPIADKALTGAALIGLSVLGELPVWVTVVILVREIGITVFRFAVLRKRVIPASRGGKLKTVVQSVAISLALLPLPHLLGAWMNGVNTVVMAAALVLTVVTGADYLVQAFRRNRG